MSLKEILVFEILTSTFLVTNIFGNEDLTCKYQNCNLGKEGHLNVHLVPHTHDDVGWLKTVDQYYYGGRLEFLLGGWCMNDEGATHYNAIVDQMTLGLNFLNNTFANQTVDQSGVQYILDTVIPSLLADETKRFIYVEMAFFSRWWNEQNAAMQSQVKSLVQQGRLEFILGGWCMNDEGATHYNAIIDQMTLGLNFLNDTFGSCGRPKVAWQIDTFGHSREQASLFAQRGFDGLFFGRLDFEDKTVREKQHKMEEIWIGSANLSPPDADLFTGVNENGYGPPKGFCFGVYCKDQPIMDNPKLEDYNVDEKVDLFVDTAHAQAKHFKTNHIMMTMGSDFHYENARMWYKNLDKLIKYVNAAHRNVTVFYSTPSCYLHALNQAKTDWTVKSDDFFPYADSPHSFWTGYFTSRPGLKGYVRNSNNVLQVCNQLEVLAQFNNRDTQICASSHTLREAMGVAQHHDAVSGTSKQHVANDYAKRLYIGRQECQSVISEVITGSANEFYFCDFLNISVCNYTQQMLQFSVHVYNPLARPLSRYFRFPVNCPSKDSSITMQDSSSVPLSFELVPVSDATKAVRRHRGNAQCELLFSVQLPALGYEAFKVTKLAEKDKRKRNSDPRFVKKRSANEDVEINNEFYKVQFDGTTGLLKSIENLQSLVVTQVRQQLLWYNSSLGNHASPQQSGAYIFRPNSSTPFTCSQDGHAQITKLEGSSLVQEVYQKFNDWAWQVFRLYKGRNDIEVEWTVGPIPLQDKWGKEIIARYDTDLLTSGYFYTDANGREVLQRKRNYRPSWTLNQSEPVAGNYYPVNTRIYIKDTKRQFTLLTDRSQGGASIKDGSLEVMVHRRLLGEDSGAVAEPLNETGQYGDGLISRGKHWLLLDTVTASAKQHRLLAEEIYMAPVIMFKNITRINNSLNAGSRLFAALPENVHLLTLSSHKSGGILIRLEHQFEKTDHAKLSSSVTISLKNLFKNFEPSSVEELLLGANVKKDDVTRLKWKAMQRRRPDASHGVQSFERPYVIDEHVMDGLNDAFDITLFPMQIRTFLLK